MNFALLHCIIHNLINELKIDTFTLLHNNRNRKKLFEKLVLHKVIVSYLYQ